MRVCLERCGFLTAAVDQSGGAARRQAPAMRIAWMNIHRLLHKSDHLRAAALVCGAQNGCRPMCAHVIGKAYKGIELCLRQRTMRDGAADVGCGHMYPPGKLLIYGRRCNRPREFRSRTAAVVRVSHETE